MNAQPLPGPYRPDGNYIHFDTPDGQLPTLLARLYKFLGGKPLPLGTGMDSRLAFRIWQYLIFVL